MLIARTRLLVVLVTVAGLVSACGSGDGASDASTAPDTSAVPPESSVMTSTTSAPPTSRPAGTFTGIDGITSDVTDTSRIVSLTGDITEIIHELGAGDRIVAVDITTTHPDEANDLKAAGGIVGFGQALTAEAVLRFDPTLVIGDETIEPPETITQLRAAGVPVVIIEYQTTLDGVTEKIRQVAGILDLDEEGERLSNRVQGEIDTAQQAAAEAGTAPRVAYLYSRGPTLLFLFGEGIPTNAMIEGAGAVDAGAEIGEGAIPLTPEALIAAAPDVIVLPESGVEGLGGFDAILEIPGVAETPAGTNGALLAYDEAYFFNLGPRTGQALIEFVEDLYALVG
jgi:iron complex transport system substrate-binding protein